MTTRISNILAINAGDTTGYEAWRMGVAPMFAMETNPPGNESGFFLQQVAHLFTDAAITSVTSAATLFSRTPNTIAQSGLDNVVVQTYLDGSYRLTAGGREIEVETGDICILDMTQTCTLATTPYTHLCFLVPRAVLAEFVPDVSSLHGLVLRRTEPTVSILVSHLKALLEQAAQLSAVEARAVVRGAAALVAACAGVPKPNDLLAGAATAVTLPAMRQAIEDNLGLAEMDAAFLLRRFAISRATLYRMFEPLGGVRNYIRHRRLVRAFQAISDSTNTDERIGTIAQRHGFASDATFSRAFREFYGMAPRDMRAMMSKEADPANPPEIVRQSFSRINRWLLGWESHEH